MSKYIIEKSGPLKGTVKIEGAKNSALPIMAASLLVNGTSYIEEVPPLDDVKTMVALLSSLGVKTTYPTESTVMLDCSKINNTEAPYDIVSKMRASFLILGPMLARMRRMRICLPGGCAIGSRPIDLHLKGLQALGAEIKQEFGYIEAYTEGLIGNKIYLDFPSVGATENIMMAAALAQGSTIIENAATEPEIVDLANYLNAMGASIRGSGTDTIKIDGVTELHEAQHTVIPDRIEAGTFMVAAAITRGEILLQNIMIDHLKPIIAKLREMGVQIEEKEKGLWVKGVEKLAATDVTTLPYPGFPTDLQAQFMALMSIVEGTSVLVETVFENRFMHVGEFKRMGGNIRVEGRSAVIEGVPKLLGAQVKATDLRAGAAMILCGLIAEGVTEISDIKHIDRGYHNLHLKLNKLGANIKRVKD